MSIRRPRRRGRSLQDLRLRLHHRHVGRRTRKYPTQKSTFLCPQRRRLRPDQCRRLLGKRPATPRLQRPDGRGRRDSRYGGFLDPGCVEGIQYLYDGFESGQVAGFAGAADRP